MERFETYSRLTGDDKFRRIAEKNMSRFEELQTQVLALRGKISAILSGADDPNNPPPEYYDLCIQLYQLEEERDQCADCVVVFSAMYLEAFIYDYAASCLGDGYVQSHLDKLDMVSKWLVVPRLVTGKQISKDSQAFEALRFLHKSRNSLVHLKSKKGIYGQELTDYLTNRDKNILEETRNGANAMYMLVDELFTIDPEHPKLRFAAKHRSIEEGN